MYHKKNAKLPQPAARVKQSALEFKELLNVVVPMVVLVIVVLIFLSIFVY
jgi:hypothetical protein